MYAVVRSLCDLNRKGPFRSPLSFGKTYKVLGQVDRTDGKDNFKLESGLNLSEEGGSTPKTKNSSFKSVYPGGHYKGERGTNKEKEREGGEKREERREGR